MESLANKQNISHTSVCVCCALSVEYSPSLVLALCPWTVVGTLPVVFSAAFSVPPCELLHKCQEQSFFCDPDFLERHGLEIWKVYEQMISNPIFCILLA